LKKAGVDNYPHYIQLAKTDFLENIKKGKFQIDGELFILDTFTGTITNQQNLNYLKYPELNREMFHNISGELRIKNEKGSFFLNYIKIPNWNWIVIIVNSSDQIYKNIYNYLLLVIPASLIPLIIGFIISFFSLKNVSARISDSLLCLREVELGNLHINIKITPVEDEIQQIQIAINQMIESLKSSYYELEQRVENRTDQLAMSNKKLLDEIQAGETARSEISYLNQYLKNIIDSMPSILIGINRDLSINQWNPEAERISLLSEKQIEGSDFSKVLNGEDSIVQKMITKIESGEIFSLHQIKIRLGNSQYFYADLSYFPLKEIRNELGILQIRDITERYKLEELMRQSEKMLSVGSLAAGMAHEINNPLAGMMQSAQNINRRLSNNVPDNITAAKESGASIDSICKYSSLRNIPDMVQSILNSGQRAAEIVENMISFSKDDLIKKKAYGIPEVLDKALSSLKSENLYKELFDQNIVSIIKNYENNLPEINCEESKIKDVFINILGNALQAMIESKSPDPTLILSIKKLDNEIRIQIEDNGPGISDEIQKRVFEPFFSTKSVDKGKGLGLSTSYFIVREHHKGNLWLESKPGKGTTFFIALPIMERREKNI